VQYAANFPDPYALKKVPLAKFAAAPAAWQFPGRAGEPRQADSAYAQWCPQLTGEVL